MKETLNERLHCVIEVNGTVASPHITYQDFGSLCHNSCLSTVLPILPILSLHQPHSLFPQAHALLRT